MEGTDYALDIFLTEHTWDIYYKVSAEGKPTYSSVHTNNNS